MSELLNRLKEAGVDTDLGVTRCVGKEDLYLMLVKTGVNDKNFDLLKTALEAGDYEKAFECAHALKGVLGNLALDPLTKEVEKLTDRLRPREPFDYRAELTEIFRLLEEFRELLKSES